jgi:hypothetical protein
MDGLSRRGFLRLIAGVPLAFGLPRLVFAGDPPSEEEAIASAQAAGRPVLLIAAPGETDEEAYRRRARTARRLHALLQHPDLDTRLALANAVMIVAPSLQELDPAATGKVWLVGHGALEGALDEDDAAAERLRAAIVARVLGGDELRPLRARRDAERARLDAGARARVDQALRELGSPDPRSHRAARDELAFRRDELLATLTLAALGEPARDLRERAAQLVLRGGTPEQPLNTEWSEFVGGCGATEPYEEECVGVDCGMGSGGKPQPYLQLLR